MVLPLTIGNHSIYLNNKFRDKNRDYFLLKLWLVLFYLEIISFKITGFMPKV